MLRLYSTVGCHLCDCAVEVLEALKGRLGFDYHIIDIADDEALVEAYGIRIPVVKAHLSGGQELGWPFSGAEFENWFLSLNDRNRGV